MQAACAHCGTTHVLDDRQIGAHNRVKFRCNKCEMTSEIDVRSDTARTMLSTVKADAVVYVEPTAVSDQMGLTLPPDKKITLRVVGGKSSGQEHVLGRPRVIVGRLGADVALDDPEISRWHCALEVRNTQVMLRDLDSRNGVFVNGQRVREAQLAHEGEFNIGGSRLRLDISPK